MAIPTVTVTGSRPQGSSGGLWANYGEAEAIGIGSPGMDSLYTDADALLNAAIASKLGPTYVDNPRKLQKGGFGINLSVGRGIARQMPRIWEGIQLSNVVEQISVAGPTIPSRPAGRKAPSLSKKLPKTPTLRKNGVIQKTKEIAPGVFAGVNHVIGELPVNVVQPTRPQVSTGPIRIQRVGLNPNQPTGAGNMALDLGSLLGQAIQGYTDYQMAGQQQNVLWNPFDAISGFVGGTDTSNPGTVTGIPKGYKMNCDGKIVKCRRRRRRRLATASDIKDLAALSSVTTGPEKKTWIATHPS